MSLMVGPDRDANDNPYGSYTQHYGLHAENSDCKMFPACKPVNIPTPKEEAVTDAVESPRADALSEARRLITGDRNNQYGPPTQDFKRTADLLNALGYARIDAEDTVHDILSSDVAIIIAQVKVSRLMHSRGKRDSWVDLAGYAGCGYECAIEEEEGT